MKYWLLLCLASSLVAFGCEEESAGTTPLGEACTGSSDCESGSCVGTASMGQLCSQACDVNVADSCPEGFACSSGFCLPSASDDTMTAGTMMNGDIMMNGGTMTIGGTMMNGGTMMTGGTMMPADNNDCAEIVTCANSCMDQACVQNCFNNGMREGQDRFNDLLTCIQGSVQSGQCTQEDFACQNQACTAELTACVGEQGPTMTGNLSCSELNTCFSMCDPNDEACFTDCFGNGTAEAQQQYGAIITCAQNSTCGEDNACINMQCAPEIQACLGGGGPAPAPGSLSCGGVFICASSCAQTDSACVQGCLNGVAADQADELEGYLGCLETNNCMDQSCVETNCSAEEAACFPPGDQSCGQVLACFNTCQDQSCLGECQLQATDEAQMELETLFNCLDANMCMGFDCAQCATEYGACND